MPNAVLQSRLDAALRGEEPPQSSSTSSSSANPVIIDAEVAHGGEPQVVGQADVRAIGVGAPATPVFVPTRTTTPKASPHRRASAVDAMNVAGEG